MNEQLLSLQVGPQAPAPLGLHAPPDGQKASLLTGTPIG